MREKSVEGRLGMKKRAVCVCVCVCRCVYQGNCVTKERRDEVECHGKCSTLRLNREIDVEGEEDEFERRRMMVVV